MSYRLTAAIVLAILAFFQANFGGLIVGLASIYDTSGRSWGFVLFAVFFLGLGALALVIILLDGWRNLGYETDQDSPQKTVIQKNGRWLLARSLREHRAKTLGLLLAPFLTGAILEWQPGWFWQVLLGTSALSFCGWWWLIHLGLPTRKIEVPEAVHNDPPPADQFGPN